MHRKFNVDNTSTPLSVTSTEEPKESVEEKVEFKEKKERDLEAPVEESDILEKLHLFVRYQLDAFDILPFDESKTVAEEKKQSTGETVDFDIQEFLEELGTPPSEKDLKSEKDDTDLRSS